MFSVPGALRNIYTCTPSYSSKVETIHNKKGVMHVVSSWRYPAFSFKVRGWATDRTEKFTRRGACRD